MTEEIKEILDYLESDIYTPPYQDVYSTKYPIKTIDKKQTKILLNYITILQKENQSLKNQLDFIDEQNKHIDKLEKMIKDYKSKYEKFQKENEELLKKLEDISLDEANIRADILLEQQDYKQRNEKAVEYIKVQQKIFKDYDIVSENQLNNLLNILQGGDE